jgi:hypothetical protein
MKIAYLVFAYKNPKLLKKIIENLSSEDCAFFIHIDRKSDIGAFSEVTGENVFFTKRRIPVYWAEFSGNQAMLILIQEALDAPVRYDYFVLLSGSEYPLRSKEYIHDFFNNNRGREFINLIKMPNEEAGKPISRIDTLRIPSSRPVYRFIVKVLQRLGLAKRDHRKYLGSMEPYAGNTWWALSREACQYIVEFVRDNEPVRRFFERVFAPEETFFHTILGNSMFKSRVHRSLVYEDWSKRGGHPLWIGEKHLAYFEENEKIVVSDIWGSGEMLFARKFSDDNLEIIQRIDDMIKRKEKFLIRKI